MYFNVPKFKIWTLQDPKYAKGILYMLFEHTNMAHIKLVFKSLSIKWNSMRIGGPAHGIVTKTAHKTLPEVVGLEV